MILDPKKTTVAYRCPSCGAGVMSVVGLFNLNADMVKLKCDCGASAMTLVYTSDSKVRISVPCVLCPNPHTFTVSSSIFFKDELFVLPCPYSDINICMTGDMNLVKAELARTELELLDLLEQNGITDFSSLHGEEEELADPQIRDIVLFVIRDLEAEGKIYCKCHPEPQGGAPVSFDNSDEPTESRYEAEITDDGIKITCLDCGASRTIPTDSMLGAHAFLNCDKLYLE
jgi:hypothetical protein